jgi:hypothetical protein
MDNQQNPTNPPAPSMPPIPTTEEGGTPPPPMPPTSTDSVPPGPESDGSAAPPPNLPPVITSTPKKKFGGGKVIATILGLLLLVGGIGAGVVLVQQKQLFQQKAAESCKCTGTPAEKNCAVVNHCTSPRTPVCYNQESYFSCGCMVGGTGCPSGSTGGTGGESGGEEGGTSGGGGESGCPPSNNNPSCLGGSVINGPCGSLETIWTCSPTGGVTLSCCKQPSGGKVKCPSPYSCLDVGTGGTGNNCSEPGYIPHSDYLCDANNDGIPDSNKVCCESPSNNNCAGIGCSGNQCTVGDKGSDSCYVNHYWCLTRSPGGCSTNLIGSHYTEVFSKDCGTEQLDIYCPPCSEGNLSSGLKYLSKTYDQDCGGGGGELSAQCVSIKTYDTEWNLLTPAQLSALSAGTVVRFTVSGTATSGIIDKARFGVTAKIGEVNEGTPSGEITAKKPGTEEFYYEYTIPAGATSISVKGEIHHATLGWF